MMHYLRVNIHHLGDERGCQGGFALLFDPQAHAFQVVADGTMVSYLLNCTALDLQIQE